MAVWRYKAVPLSSPSGAEAALQHGELSAESAADARASLRRIGLQVIAIRPQREWALPDISLLMPLQERLHRHLRSRRRMRVSEFFDGIATMLESGLPLLECLQTTGQSKSSSPGFRTMVAALQEEVRDGAALADAMEMHGGWFDPIEIAMVRAGQYAGDLPRTLRQLAERHQRSSDLAQKLTGALAYPMVVAAVGLGVVVFLSVKTLPELTQILAEADIESPPLTEAVMMSGAFVAKWWMLIALAVLLLLVAGPVLLNLISRGESSGSGATRFMQSLIPPVLRRIAIAQVARRLAELTRVGIPIVDAMRIVSPTVRFRSLRRQLDRGAAAVENGDDLADALKDDRWFDAEFRRLLSIGQSSGELDQLMERLADRYQRQSERLIDRAASLLEPAVILSLAFLIGIVVMAAVRPLVRLQEVL